jgi:negative regulator of sigma E activity
MDDDAAAGRRPGRGEHAANADARAQTHAGAEPGGALGSGSEVSPRLSSEALRLRERVSAWVDAEDPPGAQGTDWAVLVHDPEARAAWLHYHQVGDWLRSADLHGGFDEQAFLRRFSERLRAEPVQFAPGARRSWPAVPWGRLAPWAGALGVAVAGLATVVLVGGLLPQHGAPWKENAPRAAQGPAPSRGAWALGAAPAGAGRSVLRVSAAGSAGERKPHGGRLAQTTCLPSRHQREASRLHALR